MESLARRKAGISPPPRWRHPALTTDDERLRSAAILARQLGEANGWSPSTIRCAMDGLTALLADRPPQEPVLLSEVRTKTSRHASMPRTAEVLAGLDLLVDDTTASIRT